jgi:hypothetical protein
VAELSSSAGRAFSLANAFKRLGSIMGRSVSEPTEVHAPLALGVRPSLSNQTGASSEPVTPLVGARGSGALLGAPAGEPGNPFELPDSIKKIGGAGCRGGSEAYRVPSFQTGLKPW